MLERDRFSAENHSFDMALSTEIRHENVIVNKASELPLASDLEKIQIRIDESLSVVNPNNTTSEFSNLMNDLKKVEISDLSGQLVAKALLAKYLDTIYSIYQENKIGAVELLKNLQPILSNPLEFMPFYLNISTGVKLNKRQPTFSESIIGTLKRYEKMEKLKEKLINKVEGIIIGGSLSYGPFFNIRENLDHTGSSDIDLILVTDKLLFFNDNWDFFNDINFFDKNDKDRFLRRKELFEILENYGQANILSKKFQVKDEHFDISIHIFPKIIFEQTIGLNNNFLQSENEIFLIKDFKDKKFVHSECRQKNFLGGEYIFKIPEEKIVNLGVVTELLGYTIQNGDYYPGIYQNLISPMFSVYYDKTGEISKQVNFFKKNLYERLNMERIYNQEKIFSNSHIRKEVISPLLLKSIDLN